MSWSAVLVALSMALGPGNDPDQDRARGGADMKEGFFLATQVEWLQADLDFDEEEGAEDSADLLQQSSFYIKGGYRLEMGVKLWAKAGLSSLAAGTDEGVGGPEADFTYGVGAAYGTELFEDWNGNFSLEFTAGSGTQEDDAGDTDWDWTRLELQATLGTPADFTQPYGGLRFNMYDIEVDAEGDTLEGEFDTPIGIVLGLSNLPGDSVMYKAEIGFIDALTFEVAVGWGF